MVGPRPLMVRLVRDRHTNPTAQHYSPEWHLLDSTRLLPRHPVPLPRPVSLGAALKVASDLARPFPLCRVDLYVLSDGAIKAGEITLYPLAGAEPFIPPSTDFNLGRKARALMT